MSLVIRFQSSAPQSSSFAFHDQSFTRLGHSGVCHGGVFQCRTEHPPHAAAERYPDRWPPAPVPGTWGFLQGAPQGLAAPEAQAPPLHTHRGGMQPDYHGPPQQQPLRGLTQPQGIGAGGRRHTAPATQVAPAIHLRIFARNLLLRWHVARMR
jgi:hypothetical protein